MAATYVYDREVVISACLSDNDIQTIYSGGVASATTLKGGEQFVYSGGVASVTMVSSRSFQNVYGGIAHATTVSSGGKQDIGSGGVALNTIQKVGGNVDVCARGDDSNTKVTGTNENGAFSYENGVARDFIAYDWGYQYVSSGGVASATTVKGGSQFVYSGGVARATTVVSGGTQYVYSGGVTSATTISRGGAQSVNSDGVARGTTVSSGGSQYVASGGVTSAAVVSSGGQQFVDSGGVAIGTKVNKAGSLVAPIGAVISSVTLKTGASMTIASGNTLYGKNNFTGATVTGGTTAERVVLAEKATLTVGAKANMKELHLNVANANLNFTGTGNTLGSLKTNKNTKVSYDVRKVKAGATAYMLTLSTKNTQKLGAFSVVTAKAQQMGAYKLSSKLTVAKGKNFTLFNGTEKIGAVKLGTAKEIGGVSYKVTQSKGVVTLRLAAVAGKMLKGNAKGNKLAGTANCDVFWGGKGADTLTGAGGRDVAVYDKTAWGKDTIAATKGTMTIVLQGIKKSQVTRTLSSGTMVIKRKGTGQQITVKGWSANTHNIVYNVAAADLKAFTEYRNAASPTEAQAKAAQQSVFKAAKLA